MNEENICFLLLSNYPLLSSYTTPHSKWQSKNTLKYISVLVIGGRLQAVLSHLPTGP